VYPPVSRGARKRPAGSQPAGPRAKQTRQAVDAEPGSISDSDTSAHVEDNESVKGIPEEEDLAISLGISCMQASMSRLRLFNCSGRI